MPADTSKAEQDPAIPAEDLASPAEASLLAFRHGDEPGGRLLIVDDNRTNVKILERQLVREGYQVDKAYDGHEAIDRFREASPDIILLDLMMPNMNGFEFLERLRQLPGARDTQVIIVSAKSDLKDKVRGLDLGADDYITKPFQMEEIQARIRASLRIKRLQDQLKVANSRIRETQAQLIQSGKLAAIGELSAGLAHEINNPIAIIYGHAQLMRRRLKDTDLPEPFGERYRSFLETLENESRRCKTIIENLLRFSRQERSETIPVDMNQVLRAALAFFSHQLELQNVEVRLELASELPPVYGNFHQLQQVLVNIIMNAKQVMPQGGTLTLSTRSQKGQVVTTVSDTGKGIPADNLPRLFDPFFTTKEAWEGTGLGLSVSYRIVLEHHGDILVESELGRGATFQVRLPAGAPLQDPASGKTPS